MRRSQLVQATASGLADQRDPVETRLRNAASAFGAEVVSVDVSGDDLTAYVRFDVETPQEADDRFLELVAALPTAWWVSGVEEQWTDD